MEKHVEALLAKACSAEDSGDAQRFAQAALNAAHAAHIIASVANLKQPDK